MSEPDFKTHGEYATYRKGCRCDECRRASAEYRRLHRAGFRLGRPFGPAPSCLCGTCTTCKARERQRRRRSFGNLPVPTPAERFWSKVDKRAECWLWSGKTMRNGYGSFALDGKHVPAHRFAYELLVGQVPAGLDLDHLCRNRACVNPNHLEPVTRRENLRRGNGRWAVVYRHGRCSRGHPWPESASKPRSNGTRYCTKCASLTQRARREAVA